MTPAGNIESTVRQLLRDGRKIEAIQQYRLQTGSSVLESKLAVDRIDAAMGGNDVARPTRRKIESLSPALQGELAARLPDGWSQERLGTLGAELLDPEAHTVQDITEPDHTVAIPHDLIIGMDYLYLVRDTRNGSWWIGQVGPDGLSIDCWGSYGDSLGDAIQAL